MNPKPLSGRIALITGASKGLGKAMALALALPRPLLAPVIRAILPSSGLLAIVRQRYSSRARPGKAISAA